MDIAGPQISDVNKLDIAVVMGMISSLYSKYPPLSYYSGRFNLMGEAVLYSPPSELLSSFENTEKNYNILNSNHHSSPTEITSIQDIIQSFK